MKTKIILLFVSLMILSAFIYFLSDKFLFEEILFIYLLPYLIFSILFGLYALIKRLFKSKESLKSFTKKNIIASSVFNILFFALVIYITYPQFLDKKDVIGDIDFMVKKMEDIHPNLYDKITKEYFYSDVALLKSNLPEKIKIEDYYKEISGLLAKIKDGHTLPDISYLVNTGILFFKKIFPYKIKILDDKIFVIKNYSYKNDIEPGSEIIKINDAPTKQVIEETSGILSYESIIYRNYLLSNPLFLSIWNNYKDFKITYREKSTGEIKTISASGGLYSKISFQKDIMKSYMEPYYEFEILQSNIGYIEFYQFTNLSRFSSFLKETFRQIKNKGIKDLIIDIRDNGGGNSSLGDELLQYISHKPFKQFEKTIVKVSKEAISTKYIADAYKERIGSLYFDSDTSDIALRNNPLRFKGNCYLLVGEHTFSSAVDFASAYQCYDVGKIIGNETGGLTVCYGDICHFDLPRSKIIVGVSYKKFYNVCGVENGRGIIPDYNINNTIEDEQNSFDRVLDYTIKLINKKNN